MIHSVPIINRGFRDINPLEVGWEECAPGYSFGPFIRSYTLIHYIVEGRGVFENETGRHPVSAGQIFLIRPGELTTYTADKKIPWKYIWVGFDGAMAENLALLRQCVVSCPMEPFVRLQQSTDRHNTREEFVAAQIFELFSHLLEEEQPPPSYEQQVADYIRVHYMETIRIEHLAEFIGLDRRYLGRRFKKVYGMTPQEFLIQTRMEHAAEYLQHGRRVAEAAALVGYPDVFQFSKMFKKRFEITPQQYRAKKIKGEPS